MLRWIWIIPDSLCPGRAWRCIIYQNTEKSWAEKAPAPLRNCFCVLWGPGLPLGNCVMGNFPGDPVLPLHGAWVPSLVGELLKSCMPPRKRICLCRSAPLVAVGTGLPDSRGLEVALKHQKSSGCSYGNEWVSLEGWGPEGWPAESYGNG